MLIKLKGYMFSLFKQKVNVPTVLLALSMFFTGASGIVIQNLLSVTSSNILGNTYVQFGVTIALMLGAMGIGGTLQNAIKQNLLKKFVVVELILAFLTSLAPLSLYGTYALMPEHFKLVQYTWIIGVGILVGLEIPLISRINEKYQPELGDNLASIFTMDYVGSMVGGLIWTFLFLGSLDLSTSAFITAAMNLFVAILTYFYFVSKKVVSFQWKIAVAIVAIISLMVTCHYNSEQWQIDLQQELYEDHIVYNETTKYQKIVMTRDKEIDDTRLFINGNLQLSSTDEHIYHDFLVHPVMERAPSRKNVLVLGGGDGLALREILKYDDVENINLVDLDKEMIKIASSNPYLTKMNNDAFGDARVQTTIPDVEGKGTKPVEIFTGKYKNKIPQTKKVAEVSVYAVDAFKFIKDIPDRNYDVVIIDFPDPSLIELSKLYSKEFYLHLRDVTTDSTMFAIQSTSPFHAKKAYLSIQKTLEAAGYETLPYHQNVPTFGDWGWFMFWKKTENKRTVDIDSFRIDTEYITPEKFKASQVFGKGVLETKKEVEINTILNPKLLDYYVNESWKID